MDVNDRSIGRRLSAARRAAGMQTRKELTDRAGLRRVGPGTLGKIERGERPLEAHEAEAFARALNIDKAVFYDEPEGTQLDRLEQAVADLARRHEAAHEEREAIMGLLDRQSKILADIAGLLARQDMILSEIQRVVAGMPDDENLRLLNEAARELTELAAAEQAARDAPSAAQAGTGRRRASDR